MKSKTDDISKVSQQIRFTGGKQRITQSLFVLWQDNSHSHDRVPGFVCAVIHFWQGYMAERIQKEWDNLTGAREKSLAEEIDKLSQQGLSTIQIAVEVNLRVSVVWKYLRTRNPKILKSI